MDAGGNTNIFNIGLDILQEESLLSRDTIFFLIILFRFVYMFDVLNYRLDMNVLHEVGLEERDKSLRQKVFVSL